MDRTTARTLDEMLMRLSEDVGDIRSRLPEDEHEGADRELSLRFRRAWVSIRQRVARITRLVETEKARQKRRQQAQP